MKVWVQYNILYPGLYDNIEYDPLEDDDLWEPEDKARPARLNFRKI